MSGVRVVDVLRNQDVQYIKDSFAVTKGKWTFTKGEWYLADSVDITALSPVTITGNSFSIELPDMTSEEGIQIYYDVKLPYAPVDGEAFANDATLTATNGIKEKTQSGYTFLAAGGKAEGYVYSIKIKKENEEGQALKDVVFDVIRNRTGKSVGQITTDDQGEGSLGKLLNDTYTLKEIKAPEGYEKVADITINPADFDTNTKSVLKTIINKKKPAETQATIKSIPQPSQLRLSLKEKKFWKEKTLKQTNIALN